MTNATYLPLTEAADYLGVSRPTIKRLINEGTLMTTESPLDRRVKLLLVADLDRLKAAPRRQPTSRRPTD